MKNSPTTGLKTDSPNQPELTTLAGHNILFVMADKAEYGPHLQQRLNRPEYSRHPSGSGNNDAHIRPATGCRSCHGAVSGYKTFRCN